jgi:hypothetical protein
VPAFPSPTAAFIEPGLVDLPHPALGQDFTPSPTARRAQAGTGVRARSAPGELWLHEIKHDGFRVIARKDGKRVRLYSRQANEPELALSVDSRGLGQTALALPALSAGSIRLSLASVNFS